MNIEKSCGAVVFTKVDGQLRYLLVRNMEGIYGFPKGHTEGDETEKETALREVKEETGVDVVLMPDFRTEDSHPIPGKADTLKYIVYFLGSYENQTPVFQRDELTGADLYSYDEAMRLFQYESSKRILSEADAFLKELAL